MNPFSTAASWSARHPAWAILLSLLAVGAAGAGMSQAEQGRITELFVPDTLDAVQVQRDIEAIWGDTEAAFFLYIADDPTDPDLLRATAVDVATLTDLDDVQDVVGLATLLEQQLGDLDDVPDGQLRAAAQQLGASPAGDPFLANDALLIRITFPPADEVGRMTTALDDVAAQSATHQLDHSVDLRTAGVLYVEAYQQEGAGGDVALLMPLSLGVIIVVLSLLFRRVQDVAVPLITVLLAVVMAYGTTAWAGQALAPPSFIVMPLLLGLGIDYMLHIVYAYRERPNTESVAQRFVYTGQHVGWPVFFTALTTLIGFGSFLVSNIPQIRTWGLLIGSGALYAFVLGFTLMPALYRLRRKKARHVGLPLENALQRITGVVLPHRKLVFTMVSLLTVGLLISAAFVDVEADIEFEPDQDAPAVANLQAVEDRFGGQSLVLFLVDASSGGREELAAFEAALEESPYAGFVDGPLHRLERTGDPDGPLVGPATQDVATNSHWLITVGYVYEDESEALDDFDRRRDATTMDIGMTGLGVLDQESRESFLPGVAKSSAIALGLVIVLLFAIFRRPSMAALAFLPLLLAVGWQLGIMNLVGIPINPITGVMTAMILGVGVDYSLHIMAHYREGKQAGQNSLDAAQAAMQSVGRPVMAASLTTVFAFSVLAFSSLTPLRDFGLVAAIAVSSAFVISLTILPILASWLPAPSAKAPPAVYAAPPQARQAPNQPTYARPEIALRPWQDVVRPRFTDPDVQEWYDETTIREMK